MGQNIWRMVKVDYKQKEKKKLVPEARVELARAKSPLDFESSASTSSTTPAQVRYSLPFYGLVVNFLSSLRPPSLWPCPSLNNHANP